jgi:tetratricopeptide (TPR) repeat protein
MGLALQNQGKLEEAIEAYTKALSIKPDFAEVYYNLSVTKKYTAGDKHFSQIKELCEQQSLSEEKRSALYFALAKMFEDIEVFHEAFRYLSNGNTLLKKILNYEIDKDEKLFFAVKQAQPKLAKINLPITEISNDLSPIFILGMPRSGTTLVEQIVSSHSEVTGAGELDFVRIFGSKLATGTSLIDNRLVIEFRKKYLSELLKVSNGKRFVTDKMPGNFIYIPLILAAFPCAKIIHLQRSAAAVCWSNYKHHYANKGLGYSYDLSDVVAYYHLYAGLMSFWQSNYSGRIYNLNYEKLTTDQENETRELIKYLELEWETVCLAPEMNNRSVRTVSQLQVRQKVYKGSSEAWREYEPYLNGAFDGLPSL